MKNHKLITAVVIAALAISMVGCGEEDVPTVVPDVSKSVAVTAKETTEVVNPKPNTEDANSTTNSDDSRGDGPSDTLEEIFTEVESLVNSTEQIGELRNSLLKFELITEVQIFRNAEESQNAESQITDGKVEKGTVVKVFYDDGESWVEYTKH